MARRVKHEEHANHEAWAIPYGDLITLLLALFVCMYAVSSVNEGRFRVLADSLSQAFGGPPRSSQPIQIGEKIAKSTPIDSQIDARSMLDRQAHGDQEAGIGTQRDLQQMAQQVNAAMRELIDRDLVVVHQNQHWLEVEIRTDILFTSGSALIAESARPVLGKLAVILAKYPNAVRIEGHTDNVPITTAAFPSNWELSAARAASVVHLFNQSGIAAQRMSVAGYGEYRPVDDNATAQGRNRNRRVAIVVMEAPEQSPASGRIDNNHGAPAAPSDGGAQAAPAKEVPNG